MGFVDLSLYFAKSLCYNGDIKKGRYGIVKFWKKIVCAALALGLTLSFAGCGEKPVVGKEVIKCSTQLDTLVQLNAGTLDAAIIDSVMANYYTASDTYKDLQLIQDLVFVEEEYGIAGRKEDKAFVSEINKALIALADTGAKEVAGAYNLESELAVKSTTTNPLADATDDSWQKIKESGKIIVGYTVFAPIAYSESGKLTGFDIELARAVVEYLNTTYELELELEFKEINWKAKETLLSNGTVDLLWNGLTITEERSAAMCISVPYLYNKQVAVIKKADKDVYKTKEDLKDAVIGVESGSAGEDVVYGK